MISKYEFDSGSKGTKLLVLAAVHGNETAGTNALKRVLNEIEDKKIVLKNGKLVVVPICNPEAYQRDVRQIDENLNRVMIEHKEPQTYEQRLANEICPLIKDCDVLLDLHSTHCEGDVPFAFCDYLSETTKKLIDALAVDYVLEGWPDIYAEQGEIQDFSTERCAYDYGKAGTTVECGYHKSAEAVDLAYLAIMSTLAAFQMIEIEKPLEHKKTHILLKSYVVKKREGQMCKNYKHLDLITKGEEIARYDDGEILTAPADGYILLPNLKAEIGAEWYYFGVAKL
ncbi:MAG: succinylglutamate desuccinylase/aspartoacylase family protein [Acetobacter sp.]|nr:succinylglutamate desuccinylase/aspartoacylase family protein [Acetobacter sp.]